MKLSSFGLLATLATSAVAQSPSYSNSTTHPSVPSTIVEVPIIIGVEIVVFVNVVETYETVGTETVTSYVTSSCSSTQNPIYNKPTAGHPCYVCQMSSEGIACPTGSYITATTTQCPSCKGGALPTPVKPVVQTCHSCAQTTFKVAPTCPYSTDYIVATPVPAPNPPVVYTKPAAYVPPVTYSTVYNAPAQATPAPVAFTGGAAPAITALPVAGGALMAAFMLL